MKTTPFTDVHIALGAKMHEFAGFNMPIEYSGIIDEHMTVVNGVGVFDVSHMGEFWVKGPNALAFIQSVTSNDASVLPLGKAQYTCFPNDKGGIVDDLLVYHYEPEKYLLVVNAGNIDKDWDWCVSQVPNWRILPTVRLNWLSKDRKHRRFFNVLLRLTYLLFLTIHL